MAAEHTGELWTEEQIIALSQDPANFPLVSVLECIASSYLTMVKVLNIAQERNLPLDLRQLRPLFDAPENRATPQEVGAHLMHTTSHIVRSNNLQVAGIECDCEQCQRRKKEARD